MGIQGVIFLPYLSLFLCHIREHIVVGLEASVLPGCCGSRHVLPFRKVLSPQLVVG